MEISFFSLVFLPSVRWEDGLQAGYACENVSARLLDTSLCATYPMADLKLWKSALVTKT